MDTNGLPKTLRDAIIWYSDERRCHDLMVSIRWPNGMACPHCGGMKVGYLENVARFKCYEGGCRKQFSLKTGTVLEDSPIPLTKWLPAFWLLTSAKNGVSSCELARTLGVCQKTAWFMLHRIRHILATGTFEKLAGEVEVDETAIGGREANKHKSKRQNVSGFVGKTVVQALLERGDSERSSRARMHVLYEDTSTPAMCEAIRKHVKPGTNLYTDSAPQYRGLGHEYVHEFVNHALEYVRGNVHTNSLENYFSLLKRTIKGTYVAVEPFHLAKYLDEQTYRFNTRKLPDSARFIEALGMAVGRRLTYAELTSAYESYLQYALP